MSDVQHPLNVLPSAYQLQEYEFVSVLGTGGTGITYQGFDRILEKSVAVKG